MFNVLLDDALSRNDGPFLRSLLSQA